MALVIPDIVNDSIYNTSDPSKKITWNFTNASPNTTSTIVIGSTADVQYTFPTQSDIIVGQNTQLVMENKQLNNSTLINPVMTTPTLTAYQNPPTPFASSVSTLYANSRLGRNLASAGTTGSNTPFVFQPAFYNKNIMLWTAVGNATTVSVLGFNNTTTGTATARNVSTASFYASVRKVGYATAATPNSSAGTRHNATQFWRGNATGLGGFYYSATFGFGTARPDHRFFVGLYGSSAAITGEPSSLTNILGFASDSTDSEFFFMHNDGSGVATKVPLTGTFPARISAGALFNICLFAQPNDTAVYFSIEVINGGSYFESSVTTNIPSATTLLSPQIWINNTSGSAAAIDVVSQYMETDF